MQTQNTKNTGRRLIVGDIHARYTMLREALDKASFDPDNDILYSVGDLCDRGTEPLETLRYLMSLPDFRPVLGNHDEWMEEFLVTERPDDVWFGHNGGNNTYQALLTISDEERKKIRRWLGTFPVIRIENDAIIVHGGFSEEYTETELINLSKIHRPVPMSKMYSPSLIRAGIDLEWMEGLLWDRDYLFSSIPVNRRGSDFWPEREMPPIETSKTIYIGHTPLVYLTDGKPMYSEKYHLVALDTGAGSGLGPVTVLDMATREYWQSSLSK